MDTEDGDEVLTFKASAALLQELSEALPKLLWKEQNKGSPRKVHRYVRPRSLDHVIDLIEPFQNEPQLLDAKLSILIIPLVDSYLEYLQQYDSVPRHDSYFRLDSAVSQLLYTFCKVRGESVIAGFLSNEPRRLNLILGTLERVSSASSGETSHSWQVRYILVLWLWHLVLAPFSLSTISASSASQAVTEIGLGLSSQCPPIAKRLLSQSILSLSSFTREHQAAAKLLVRLLNRPDMQELRVHEALIPRACDAVLQGFQTKQVSQLAVGYLRVLVGVTATCSGNANSLYIENIWTLALDLYDKLFMEASNSSAIHRKLLIKLLRNIAPVCLESATAFQFAEQNGVVEETIDKLLQALSDKDTQVRFAAAKAMGAVMGRLGVDQVADVVEAIIDSFEIDSNDIRHDFSFQDPQKWHGLTLSLAHCLFKRSISAAQLPSVIAVVIPALNFERRAVTGNSLGTSVRDAACFAIWSLARRYTTAELLKVDLAFGDNASMADSSLSIIQYLAIMLMTAACLDPNGNIRRGCSAALQEMIGRHPDQVNDGISLIQIIDYQAVGLRRRAMVDLVAKASTLDSAYWRAFLGELQGWRGIGSPDSMSRYAAAKSIGQLCISASGSDLLRTLQSLSENATQTVELQTETRHGALTALCEIIEQKITSSKYDVGYSAARKHMFDLRECLSKLDFNLRAVRADLPAATARYCTIMYKMAALDAEYATRFDFPSAYLKTSIDRLLIRSEGQLLRLMPELIHSICRYEHDNDDAERVMNLGDLRRAVGEDARRPVIHGAARVFALAATLGVASISPSTLEHLVSGLTDVMAATVVEWRVLAMRAITLMLRLSEGDILKFKGNVPPLISATLTGLTDYTITERGDVGSLVRLEALCCVQEMWKHSCFRPREELLAVAVYNSVVRLALERLDKVRQRAWATLSCLDKHLFPATDDVSSRAYFRHLFTKLDTGHGDASEYKAIVKGVASCAGTGAEHLLQGSRAAASDVILGGDGLPGRTLLAALSAALQDTVEGGQDPVPLLEFLAFVLESFPGPCLHDKHFKWLTLLSRVQKAHYKSLHQQRLAAAIGVYRNLASNAQLRPLVLKKLESMAKTNPIGRIRHITAEALWAVTGSKLGDDEAITKPPTGKEIGPGLKI